MASSLYDMATKADELVAALCLAWELYSAPRRADRGDWARNIMVAGRAVRWDRQDAEESGGRDEDMLQESGRDGRREQGFGGGRTEGLHTGDAEEVESVSEGLRGRGHGAPEQSEDGAVGGGSRTVGQAEDCKGTVHDRGGDSTGVKIGPFHVRGSFLACSILHQLVSSYMP